MKAKTEKMTTDDDGNEVPRLDCMPIEDAARALGITVPELETLQAQGFELYDALGDWNNLLVTQSELAAEMRISPRQIRNYEDRGLPFVGERQRKRYPWPLAAAWVHIFRHRSDQLRGTGVQVNYLDPREALSEYNAHQAVSRAFCYLRRPDRYRRGLDAEAQAKIPEARKLIERGRIPLAWSWD